MFTSVVFPLENEQMGIVNAKCTQWKRVIRPHIAKSYYVRMR